MILTMATVLLPMRSDALKMLSSHRCVYGSKSISRKLLEAQLFNQQYRNYEDIPNVQDKLRWCCHHMGLMQKEVVELIGITRGHYIDFEVGYVEHYPKEIVDKLAALYQIPIDDRLDDYNRFLI